MRAPIEWLEYGLRHKLEADQVIRLAVQEAVEDVDSILEEDGAEKNLALWGKIRDHFKKAGY